MYVLNFYDVYVEVVQVVVFEVVVVVLLVLLCNDFLVDGFMFIFIVGLLCFGFMLLDYMFSVYSDVVFVGEINDFQCQLYWVVDVLLMCVDSLFFIFVRVDLIDFQLFGQCYWEQICWCVQGWCFYIDKMLINFCMVFFICWVLFVVLILYLVCVLMDVCYFNFKVMFGNILVYCYDMGVMVYYYGLYWCLV